MTKPLRSNRHDGAGAEVVLVWAWRRIVASRGNCPMVEREFLDLADEAGTELLLTYAAFLKALGHGSRRTLTIAHPGFLGFTADERRVLGLIAAAQAGDEARLASHIAWLVRPASQTSTASAARAFARMLADSGILLPPPPVIPPARVPASPLELVAS